MWDHDSWKGKGSHSVFHTERGCTCGMHYSRGLHRLCFMKWNSHFSRPHRAEWYSCSYVSQAPTPYVQNLFLLMESLSQLKEPFHSPPCCPKQKPGNDPASASASSRPLHFPSPSIPVHCHCFCRSSASQHHCRGLFTWLVCLKPSSPSAQVQITARGIFLKQSDHVSPLLKTTSVTF